MMTYFITLVTGDGAFLRQPEGTGPGPERPAPQHGGWKRMQNALRPTNSYHILEGGVDGN